MRRFLATVLLALLPFQFSWAAMASYCGHATPSGVEYFGHHDHKQHAHAGDGVGLDDGKASGAMNLDCGHCNGACSMMLNLPSALPGGLSTAPPSATLDEAGGAHAPTRPERPQWLALA